MVDEDSSQDPSLPAAIWHGGHALDLGYLSDPPRLRFWRTVDGGRDEVRIEWQENSTSTGTGSSLRLRVPTREYVDAVVGLDHDLMATMDRRIEELEARGGLPGVELDLRELRREHHARAGRLSTHHLSEPVSTDWAAVRLGARMLMAR